jgi:ABC-type multidrug transport system ATPase subunit
LDSSQRLRLEARNLEKVVRVGNGSPRKLLDNINLAVEPGEFVGLLGPSGSGKSTLMDCLNGRRPATGGRVLANGEDFYRHFDSFRQSLGYVPQRDIVHTQLTVYRALYYTAQLRLPTDTEPAELETRVEEVLRLMELAAHRQVLVAQLSGGQIKRVSLGAELIARPCLLYIDEATSGLDAGTEARMMRLFRQLADEGKSVLCITHNVENVDRCNTVVVLNQGKLVYLGPPQEAPAYFHVQRLSQIYDRLNDQEAEIWEKEFLSSRLHQEFVEKRLAAEPAPEAAIEEGRGLRETVRLGKSVSLPKSVGTPLPLVSPRPAERPYRPPLWHQFRVLTARYADLIRSDRRNLRLLLLQAPVVAIVLLLGFVNKPYDGVMPVLRPLDASERKALEAVDSLLSERRDSHQLLTAARDTLQQIRVAVRGEQTINAYELLQGLERFEETRVIRKLLDTKGPVVPGADMVNPRYTYMLLYIMAIVVLWFGCNNAAKEIVNEDAIYGRERAVNLGILPYLGSKFLLLSVASAVQTLGLMLLVYGTMALLHAVRGNSMPYPEYRLDYASQYGVLLLLAMSGVALGLLISACVSTADRANTLLPYVLIPQIILGGGIMQFSQGPLYWLACAASPVYWAYRAIHLGASRLPEYIPGYVNYHESVSLACAALAVQTVLLLLATAWFLRRKDVSAA